MLDNNDLVTLTDVCMLAFKLYYSPVNLASKAVVFQSLKEGIWSFDEDGKIKILDYSEKVQSLLSLASSEPQQIMDLYQIKEFTASRSWAYNFVTKHGFSFRKGHYERRGAIREDMIDIYLKELAAAILK